MSLFELLLVIIIGFLVLKPEDIHLILAKVKQLRAFINGTKKEIMAYIEPDNNLPLKNSQLNNFEQEMEQMNFYLSKIANFDSEYEGEYSLTSIKEYYRKLVNSKISKDIKKHEDPNAE